MLSKYLDPKNDFAFKRLFGNERNKDILIHFLNDMIVFENGFPVVDVTFLKTSQDPEVASKKTSIVDVSCEDQNGNKYIVEMQVAKEQGFEKRAQYYAAKMYGNQLNKGEDYPTLRPVYFLAITDFLVFDNHDRVKSDHVILDRETHDHQLKDLSFTFVELPKFHKEIDKLETVFDKWCYFFKYADETSEQDLAGIVGDDTVIFKAYEEVNQLGWSEIERRTYDQVVKAERDYYSSIDQARAEGKEEGREEGILQAKREMVLQLKSAGMPCEKICEITGLTFSEIGD